MFGSLLLVVIAIGLLHFFTPGELGVYHGTYRRLSYFPIVMGAIWFGIRGGLFFSAISRAIADRHRRHPRAGRKLDTPVVVCTLNTYQDEVTTILDPAMLDRFKLVRFSPFVSERTYARYAAKLLDSHLFTGL